MTDDVSPETFREIAKRAGVTIEPEELERMRDGYVRLQGLLARLPQAPAMFEEPATVFVPAGSAIR